eukprot:3006924-Rhodomonas_salina.5
MGAGEEEEEEDGGEAVDTPFLPENAGLGPGLGTFGSNFGEFGLDDVAVSARERVEAEEGAEARRGEGEREEEGDGAATERGGDG